MKITPRKYAESLLAALESAPKDKASLYFDNFLKIVERNNDVKILPDIAREIEKIKRENSGIKTVTVTTATPLSRKTAEEISKKLEKTFSSKIEIKADVKADILGGVMIEAGEYLFDKSLKTYINKFKNSIIS